MLASRPLSVPPTIAVTFRVMPGETITPDAAKMLALPGATPVATPVLAPTETVPGLLDVQVARVVMLTMLLSV